MPTPFTALSQAGPNSFITGRATHKKRDPEGSLKSPMEQEVLFAQLDHEVPCPDALIMHALGVLQGQMNESRRELDRILPDLAHLFRIGRLAHRRVHRVTGGHDVDRDVIGLEFLGERPRKALNAEFGRAIGRLVDIADNAGIARHIDDRTRLTGLHRWGDSFYAKEGALEVDRKQPVPILNADLLHRLEED